MGQMQNDDYPTNERLARAIVQQEKSEGIEPAVIIEPSCGAGAFIKACREAWPQARIIGVDIVGRYRNQAVAAGATEFIQANWMNVAKDIIETEQEYGRILVIGNPPFSHAQPHIEVIMRHLAEGDLLSFLLRFSFFGSMYRAKNFWPQHRPFFNGITPLVPRPSYLKAVEERLESQVALAENDGAPQVRRARKKTKTATDNSEYAVFHFIKTGERVHLTFPPFIKDTLIWKEGRAA